MPSQQAIYFLIIYHPLLRSYKCSIRYTQIGISLAYTFAFNLFDWSKISFSNWKLSNQVHHHHGNYQRKNYSNWIPVITKFGSFLQSKKKISEKYLQILQKDATIEIFTLCSLFTVHPFKYSDIQSRSQNLWKLKTSNGFCKTKKN